MTTTAIRERPILFSGPMVKALLSGRKTQTRRVVKDKHIWLLGDSPAWCPDDCPYGKPGDRLWVRETFALRSNVDPETEREKAIHYLLHRADYEGDIGNEWHWYGNWRPSIFMPRWASRITLEITNVRVERLQKISLIDAEAEGVEWNRGPFRMGDTNPISAFRTLWNSINGDRKGCSWTDNPWLWCLSFRRIEQGTTAS